MQYYFDFLHLCMYIPPTHLQYTKQQTDEEKGRNKDTRYCTRYQDAHAAICPSSSSSSHRMFDFLLGHTTRRKMRWMEQQIIDLCMYVRGKKTETKTKRYHMEQEIGDLYDRGKKQKQKQKNIRVCPATKKVQRLHTHPTTYACMYVPQNRCKTVCRITLTDRHPLPAPEQS